MLFQAVIVVLGAVFVGALLAWLREAAMEMIGLDEVDGEMEGDGNDD